MVFQRCYALFLTSIILPMALTSNLLAQLSWEDLSEKAQTSLVEAAYCRINFGFNDSITLTRLKTQPFDFDASKHTFFLQKITAACQSTDHAAAIAEIAEAMTKQYRVINALNQRYQRFTICNADGEISARKGHEEEAEQIQKNLKNAEEIKKDHELNLKIILRDALVVTFNTLDTNSKEE